MDHNPTPRNWMPWEFVEVVSGQSLEDFCAQFTRVAFLLVRVDKDSSGLATWLQATSTLPRSEADASASEMSYVTTYCEEADLQGLLHSDPSPSGQIAPAMIDESYFIVPVRRREWKDADPMDRIWVGRARNNDIVIRDRTVSKCHAWFEYDTGRRIYLKDAGSRNATRVNGGAINGRVELKPGDRISFGSADTRICSAEALWEVLSG